MMLCGLGVHSYDFDVLGNGAILGRIMKVTGTPPGCRMASSHAADGRP